MPRWEVHLGAGLLSGALVSFSFFMGALDGGGPKGLISVLGQRSLPIALGSLALLAGSLLPDMDGRGVIRWFIGPLSGAMAVLPPLLGSLTADGLADGIVFLHTDGVRIFFIFCALGYLALLLPVKHRGGLHSKGAGVIFGLVWGGYLLLTAVAGPLQSAMAGSMGCLGYSWHLALDGRL